MKKLSRLGKLHKDFLVKEVDQVRKKQKVNEPHFADIDWEVSLLKIQIREEKKEDAICQSLKKDIDQLRNQIGQVEAKVPVKMEQDNLGVASGQHSEVPLGHIDL